MSVANSVGECVRDADIVVTATSSNESLLYRSMLKDNVHINGKPNSGILLLQSVANRGYTIFVSFQLAVGAGQTHISEINSDVYSDTRTQIYIDNFGSARTEMAPLFDSIVAEVGDLINGTRDLPADGITIFHSMGKIFTLRARQKSRAARCLLISGMAVEDAAVAEAVLEKYLNNL